MLFVFARDVNFINAQRRPQPQRQRQQRRLQRQRHPKQRLVKLRQLQQLQQQQRRRVKPRHPKQQRRQHPRIWYTVAFEFHLTSFFH